MSDALSLARGNHSFKFGGEIHPREDHPRHAAQQLRRLHLQRHQDRQRIRRLPARPAHHHEPGRARPEDRQRLATSASSRRTTTAVSPRVTLNLGVRYDVQFPFTDPHDRKLAFVPGKQSKVSPTAPAGLLFPGDPGVSRGIISTDFNNFRPASASPGIPSATAKPPSAARLRHLLRQHLRQRVEHHLGQPALRDSPALHDRVFTFRSLRCSLAASALSRTATTRPRFVPPSAEVFGRARLQIAVHLPDEPHGPEGAVPRLQRQRVLRGRARPQAAGERRPQLPRLRARRDHGQRQRAAAVSAGRRSARPGARVRLQHRLPRPAAPPAEKRGAHFSAKAYYTFSKALEDTEYQGGGLPRSRTRIGSTSSVDAPRTTARTSSSSPASGGSTTSGAAARSLKALLNDWTLSGIVCCRSGRPAHDRLRPRPQPRRAHH